MGSEMCIRDRVGPLPPSQGFTHLFTIVDRFTRWPEAIPLTSTDTKSCARALLSHWIARFGLPQHITSDRGPQFTSQLWSSVSELYGSKVQQTTAYHPQANGLVERFHRHLKSSLKSRLRDANWSDELPWVMLGIRSAPKGDLGCSSAELVYGSPLTVPGEFLRSPLDPSPTSHLRQLREFAGNLSPVPTSRHGAVTPYIPRSIGAAEFVFVRTDSNKTPLQAPYTGPFRVIARSDKHFTLDYGGKQENVSLDRLKAAHVDPSSPVQVALPPRRGRPPLTRI